MKLIEINQPILIQCDNPGCDFTIPNPTGDPAEETKQYINVPCPKCGWNLLTQEDYDQSARMLKVINWINKWFGWMDFFSRKKKEVRASVHVHKGVTTIKTDYCKYGNKCVDGKYEAMEVDGFFIRQCKCK